jgi:hypothetical protein
MNCFNHPDIPAVGICKYCQKGLCKDCAIDSGYGIACKYHRENVKTQTIQTDSKQTLQNTEILILEIPRFFFGIFLILLGYSKGADGKFIMAIGILGFWLFMLISAFDRMKKTQNK